MSASDPGGPSLAVQDLLGTGNRSPIVGIVVHHGFAELAGRLADRREAPLRSLGGFEADTSGGNFVLGRLAGVEIVLLDPGPVPDAVHIFTSDRPVEILAETGVSVVLLVGPTRAIGAGLEAGELVRLVELEREADPAGEGKGFDPALGAVLDGGAVEAGHPLREGVVRAEVTEAGIAIGAARPRAGDEVTGRWFSDGIRMLGGRKVRVVALAVIAPVGEETVADLSGVSEVIVRFVDGVSRRPSLLVRVPPPDSRG